MLPLINRAVMYCTSCCVTLWPICCRLNILDLMGRVSRDRLRLAISWTLDLEYHLRYQMASEIQVQISNRAYTSSYCVTFTVVTFKWFKPWWWWSACSSYIPTIRVRIPLTPTVFSFKICVFFKNENKQTRDRGWSIFYEKPFKRFHVSKKSYDHVALAYPFA